jgi:anionic glutamate receptor
MKFCIALILLPLMATQAFGDAYKTEKEILDKVLNKNIYDLRIVPRNYNESTKIGGPVVVRTNMFIRSMDYIDTHTMTYKMQLTFRLQWHDPRLRFDDMNGQIKYLVLQDMTRIWIPDVFFSNSQSTESHTDLVPNVLLRIYPDGSVLFSKRLTTTLSCPMDLMYYPFDKQTCPFVAASYGYTTDDIILLWKEGDPVQVSKNLKLSEFVLQKHITSYCTSRTNTGEYSCMKLNIQLRRSSVKYTFQWFVTTGILTFLSFISFWMKSQNSSRIKYLVIILLVLYSHIVVINMWSSPKTTYYMTKDWWFMWCVNFVVAVIIEWTIVRLIDRKCGTKSLNECRHDFGDGTTLKPLVSKDSLNSNCGEKWRNWSFGRKVDLLSAVIFPVLFIVYIAYFCHKTFGREDWNEY